MTERQPPYLDENDPGRWGHSLANLSELLLGCLDAAGARSVAEVGAYAGDLTRLLLDWAGGAGGRVVAIDPTPHQRLIELAESTPELELIQEPSFDALAEIELPDAVIIDGDHNYFTVNGELTAIGERAPGADIPLLLFHDLGWPHGRRDAYWTPDRIPAENRRPMVDRAHLFPGESGLVDEGLPMYATAAEEGGPGNGVLTALEDFLEGRADLEHAIVPAFFGFGVVWHRDAPGAEAIRELIGPWDRNPVIERLEQNRLFHLASSNARAVELKRAREESQRSNSSSGGLFRQREELNRLRSLAGRQGRVLQSLLDSGGLRIADGVSALRHPGRDWSWRERALDAMGDRDFASSAASAAEGPLRWVGADRFQLGEVTFQVTPPEKVFLADVMEMDGADLLVFKSRAQIDRYLQLFAELRPRRIVELGIYFGGSVGFFFELADPERLVAIDLDQGKAEALARYVEQRGLSDRLRVHEGVDQSDRARLREIIREDLGPEPLDLVIDDCSHSYEPTRASFNELFPRLRMGGVYVIEDWGWLFAGNPNTPDDRSAPLSRLIAELMIAVVAVPSLVAEVTIEFNAVFVTRGSADSVPADFDIAAITDPRARQLLAAD